jgi:hypothetical protein
MLFNDLEARMDAEDRAQHDLDVADLVRAERSGLRLPDRLRAHVGHPLTWYLVPAAGEPGPIEARLVEVGHDWVLLGRRHGGLLVPMASVAGVGGLSRAAAPDDGPLARRLGLTVVLRGLARDRAPVAVRGPLGPLTGTIDRVGADHLDLAVHPLDVPRRPREVRSVRCLPLTAVAAVAVAEPAGDRG